MLAELARTHDALGDHAALAAACEAGVGLCTIVGIEGSFSRRRGAQLAVQPNGTTVGSLADGCLEAQLASDLRRIRRAEVIRYGHGSPRIDFRLPCGGGLDILLDPEPDRDACRRAMVALADRIPAVLRLPDCSLVAERRYSPALKIAAFGEGPEIAALEALASAMGIELEIYEKSRLSLGQPVENCRLDAWTAVLLLFHDHEWEVPLLEQAIASEAFYIGAQGGENARIARTLALASRGIAEEQIARIRSPVGLIAACRTPGALALSALAEIVGRYEQLHVAA